MINLMAKSKFITNLQNAVINGMQIPRRIFYKLSTTKSKNILQNSINRNKTNTSSTKIQIPI